MKCPVEYCKKGFRNCCRDCGAYQTNICQDPCAAVEQCDCIWTREQKENSKSLKTWIVILLIAVVSILAIVLWQTKENMEYIQAVKKEQAAATELLQNSRYEGIKYKNSIAENGGKSNDR